MKRPALRDRGALGLGPAHRHAPG